MMYELFVDHFLSVNGPCRTDVARSSRSIPLDVQSSRSPFHVQHAAAQKTMKLAVANDRSRGIIEREEKEPSEAIRESCSKRH